MGHTLHLGWPTVIESYAEKTPFGVVFEDDGGLAYFYAVDTRHGAHAVVDAVCIYHVTAVVNHLTPGLDAHHDYDVRIVWSDDQQRVALLLDGTPHAAFDFEHKRASCRSNFPEASSWSADGHAWDDRAVEFLAACSEEGQPVAKYTMLSSLTS